MRTSSRSESENHFFSKFTHQYLTLVEFMQHHDTAMEHQRYVQQQNDHNTRYTIPDLKTDLKLEKTASVIYTRSIFYDVQDEIVASYTECMSVTQEKNENTHTYMVKDRECGGRIYKVEYIPLETTAVCACKKFELYGLLCRHIFYVFRIEDLQEFPTKYVLKRWSTEAIPEKEDKYDKEIDTTTNPMDAVREMMNIVEETANRLVHNPEKFAKYREKLSELLQETKAEFPIAKPIDRAETICSFYGVKQPGDLYIKNPKDVRTKGRKRKQSKGDEAYDKAKKAGNQCKKCKEYGHNSRTCKNPPAGSAVQDTPQIARADDNNIPAAS